jgi:predicted aldo/keto reductase-like oxidoreductase
MNEKRVPRRDFLRKSCTAAAAALAAGPAGALGRVFPFQGAYRPHGVKTRILGDTGVRIPIIVFGGGSRFCGILSPDRSIELLNYALDHGFYYWDTSHTYIYDGVCSEERYGLVLKDRRREVFLATKLSDRSYDGAMRELEGSLKRMQTDRVDLLQIHSIESMEDVDRIGRGDGILKALLKAKAEGITRFIGFSGHSSAEAMAAMAERFSFDTMLIALNHYSEGREDFERRAVPVAARKGMGVLLMKAIRPRETAPNLDPDRLVRYALSLRHAHAVVIGTDGMEVLKRNLQTAREFLPLEGPEMERLRAELEPFFSSRSLPWMRPGYVDGTAADPSRGVV